MGVPRRSGNWRSWRRRSNFTSRAAKDGALDFAQLHAGWADKLARTLGVPLAQVAPSVWHATAQPPARTREAWLRASSS